MSEWQEVRLGDICKIKGGKRLPKDHYVCDEDTGYPYLRVSDLSTEGFSGSNLKFITKEAFSKIKNYTISVHDIYISIAGTIGHVGRIPSRYDGISLTENCAKFTQISNNIDTDYLMYFLRSAYGRDQIESMTGGATQPKLALTRIAQIKMPVPPLPTQQKIAKILSNYDDLIENNLKRIKLLEESARLTYEMKLEDCNSWKEFKLVDISDYFGRGVTPKYKENSGFLAINQKANKGSFLSIINFKEYEPGNWVPEEKYAQNGDVLINSLGEGTIGRVHFYNWDNNKYPVDQHMSIFRAQKNISIYIFHLLSSELGQAILHTIKKGGTNMTMLNINDLRNIKIRLPSQHEFDNASKAMIEMYDLKSKLEFQNQLLKEAREILLPRLMTGMIDTDDMDIAV